MSVLAVEGLTKRYGSLVALNALSFAVEPGRILAVIGPNGAGKSTLFKVITGFERPSGGRVRLGDRDITGLPPETVARRGVVRTFQENAAFAEMTVREAVVLAHHLHDRRGAFGMVLPTTGARAEDRRLAADAEQIIDQFGLADVADRRAKELPHGQLRALGIAVAIAAEPTVLLLDEPFAGLNPEETDEGVARLARLRDRGLTIVLVEHDMRAVMSISDRIVVLNFGTKIAEGPPDAVRVDPAVIEAYLGAEDAELGL